MKPITLYLAIACLGFTVTASATDYYVSPSGNDQANGLYAVTAANGANGPFQTLARAQSAIRALKSTGQFNQAVTVHVAAGNYQQPAPLQFDLRDSGMAGRVITWVGTGPTTVISGGKTLNNCQPANGMWSCPTSGLGLDSIKYSTNLNRRLGNMPGFSLFVNTQRMTLARWPDTDWAHIKTPVNQTTTFTSFEQLPNIQSEMAHAVAHIFPASDWFDQYVPLASVAQAQNQITLGANVGGIGSGYRFYLQNLLSQLNAPSEWFYDQPNARVLFIPPVGVLPTTIVASAQPNLINMSGVNYVTFQNMSFRYTTDVTVNIVNSSNLLFDKIELANVDTNGIQATASNNITISNSYIHDTGRGGIFLDGGDRTTLQSSNNVVSNTHFQNFGTIILTYSPGISVSGVGADIIHNLIEQGSGNGVAISGNSHIFEKNEVRNVCAQSSDCGALYSGRDWTWRGNIIRYNHFHDNAGYGLQSVDVSKNIVKYVSPANVSAVYLDDAVSSFNIIGNIFNNAGSVAIRLGGGRDHIIANNVFNVFNDYFAIYTDNRWPGFDWSALSKSLNNVPYKGAIWAKTFPALTLPMKNPTWPEGNSILTNVIIANNNGAGVMNFIMPRATNIIANNLYWAAKGKVIVSYQILDNPPGTIVGLWQPWQNWINQGVEKNSINADPCVTFSGNKVSFCTASPVNKIGFQALPIDIGLLN